MENLRIPGPTPCPPEVLQAMAKQMINHRGPEFAQMLAEVTANLRQLFQTKNDVLLLTGAGTGGLESAVVNMLSPGDKVLSVSMGVFGDRWLNIAQQFGAKVVPLKVEWGKAADPDALRQALKADPEIKAVMITHNETSTGVTNDLKALSTAVKEFDKLLMVDAISSLGSVELPVDDWHCDVVVTGSQKGWMVPPGMTMVSVSPAGWQANAKAKMPRFYWDFGRAKKSFDKDRPETPWTPAVSIVFALQVALRMMLKEGLSSIVARHARVGKVTREGVEALGLPLFADKKYASNTVTAVAGANGLDIAKMRKLLKDKYQIVVSGGQMALDGKIFRIGHLGWVTEDDVRAVVNAMKEVLPQAGFRR